MARFYISDVMSRKQDNVEVGYVVIVRCEGDKNSVESSFFLPKIAVPIATKETLKIAAENWLSQKEGTQKIADIIASKLAVISDESVKTLIDNRELVIK